MEVRLLEDPDPEVRMWAVGGLCSDPPHFGIQAAEVIAERLHDEERDVAKFTADSMSSLKHAHVAAVLREHAPRISDPLVKDLALRSARSIDDALRWRGLPDWVGLQDLPSQRLLRARKASESVQRRTPTSEGGSEDED